MSQWRADLRDDEDPVRSALELGLRRQPLDVGSLVRVRAAVRTEFESLHGWRAQTRRWPRRMATMAATLAGLTALAAGYLFQGEEHDLTLGADVASLEGITSGGASISQEFEIDNRALSDFLGWVAHETGRHIEFADDQARDVAGRTLLHGSVQGLPPLAALEQVVSTTSLRYEVDGDVIRVSSRR